jgi:hypothetical protein
MRPLDNPSAKKIDKLHESAKRINKGGIPQRILPIIFQIYGNVPAVKKMKGIFFEALDRTGRVRAQNPSENNT